MCIRDRVNKENLLNQSAFLLGVPGSGKSFSAKELIVFLALSTNDDILVCDPENEYSALIKALGGEVIPVSYTHLQNHCKRKQMFQTPIWRRRQNPVSPSLH